MQNLIAILTLALLATHFTTACQTPTSTSTSRLPSWTLTPTNTTQQFRGLGPVSNDIVWVSGTKGTVLRTNDAGSTWTDVSPHFSLSENASNFEFRDIEAWSANSAVILSIGEGNLSRIYQTRDGGETWKMTFVNQEAAAFYDCMAFEKEIPSHGIARSDPVNGRFRLIETWDSGSHWSILSMNGTLPAALPGEFGFAASGTCIEAAAGRWYIATGGVDPGRIFRSTNPRLGWHLSNSSITGAAAAGVFSVRFRDAKDGIAVGGDFEKPTANKDIASWSCDGGVEWHKAVSFPGGYRSDVAWVPGRKDTAVAVGTSGSDITFDGGRNWTGFGNGTFDAVECINRGVCWASGARGRVAKLVMGDE
ncbi:oxidoreductase [Clohesyomyces aquaticus]|uniref:Oxidoreductase n=1 Tax=Clohesyomyces aquaticus TaxID=1231657 RepID=A0A1Y1ZTM0_9PLEO|nr:oxidoreductase [Clohesyomyces aquaticus]